MGQLRSATSCARSTILLLALETFMVGHDSFPEAQRLLKYLLKLSHFRGDWMGQWNSWIRMPANVKPTNHDAHENFALCLLVNQKLTSDIPKLC